MLKSSIDRIATLFKKLQKGDDELNHSIQQAILLLGSTGAGKTTSSYVLTNKQLVSEQLYGQTVYKYKQKYLDAQIGHTKFSCTEIPNSFEQNQGILIDCPGFLDSFKFDRYITNAYYIYRIFSNSKKLKFIFTCNQASLTATRSRDFIESFKCFLDLFHFDQNFTGKQLAKSTVLLITKATIQDKNCVTQMLDMLMCDPPELDEQKSKAYVECLEHLIKQKKIYFISAATVGQSYQKNKILNEIHSNTIFWERREEENGTVSLKNINFQIKQKNMKKDESALALKACQGCNQSLTKIAKSIAGALEQIQKNLNNQHYKFQFFDKWKQLMQQNYSFNGKQTNYKETERYTNKYLRNLQFLNKVHLRISTANSHEANDQQRFYLTKNLMLNLIQNILQYIKITSQQQKILSQFSYLIARKFEEINVLKKLSDVYGKINRQAFDFIIGFTQISYHQLQKQYALNYKIKQDQVESYYLQIGQFLKKYKEEIIIIQKLQQIQFHKGQLAEKNDEKSKALRHYITAIKYSQIVHQKQNKQYYKILNKHLYQKVANILLQIKNYRLALTFYKVINYIQKIRLCYDEIYKISINKVINRIEKGDYLKNLTLFQEAIGSYIEAINVSENIEDKTRAVQRITDLYQNKERTINDFKKKLIKSQFYNKLPDEFNYDEVTSQLEDQIQS